jgi:hypothetical protein
MLLPCSAAVPEATVLGSGSGGCGGSSHSRRQLCVSEALGTQGVELSLHQIQPAEEVHELRPCELRAEVSRRVLLRGGGGGRLAQTKAEEGDGLGGAGEVAAGHLNVGGPVDRLEQRRAAERRASELAAGCDMSAASRGCEDEARGRTLERFALQAPMLQQTSLPAGVRR